MNLNQIINMAMRILMRKGLNWGINKGTEVLARRTPAAGQGRASTPAAGKQAQDARALAKRARQAARITRRLGR